MVNDSTLDTLFADSKIKPPLLPEVAKKIVAILEDDNFSMNELATIIKADPSLVRHVLKIVNSPLFATEKTITDIETSIEIFYSNNLKYIFLSFVIFDALSSSEGSFDQDLFWNMSITNAVIAKTLADKLEINRAGIFLTALLKDIGSILIFQAQPRKYETILAQHPVHEIEMADTERNILGLDHAEVGTKLLQMWGFPEAICLPVRFHASTSNVPLDYQEIVNILQLSTLISSLFNAPKSISGKDLIKIRKTFREELEMEDFELIKLLDEISKKSIGVLKAYDVPVSEIRTYSKILQDSHEELYHLNFAYEDLLVSLQESRENAKDLAEKLTMANEELTSMAYRDSLTGLYNHRFFHETFDKEISNAKRHGRALSLLMLDIDSFKPINDTLGHKFGDKVLKIISGIITDSIRVGDIASRVGGDEFAILFPETVSKEGSILAERLRASVEKSSDQFQKTCDLRYSISVGVGTFFPTDESETKEHIIELVDKALYRSKEEGKNRVTVV